jgi:hypothetical protein
LFKRKARREIEVFVFKMSKNTAEGRDTDAEERKRAADAEERRRARSGDNRARPEQPEEDKEMDAVLLLKVAKALGVTTADLPQITPELRSEAVSSLTLSLSERGRVTLALAKLVAKAPPTSENKTLSHFFREQEEQKTYPWKVWEHRAAIQLEHCRAAFAEKDAIENLQRTFLATVKAQLLSPFEAVVCQHLLFGDNRPFQGFFLATLLLTTPPAQRLQLHNWQVAAAMPTNRREAYGAQIAALASPLLPDLPETFALNTRLLNDVVLQGGAPQIRKATVYADAAADAVWGGANPIFPVLTGPNGQYVDLSLVEGAVIDLQTRTAALQEQIAKAGAARPMHSAPAVAQRGGYRGRAASYRGASRGGRGGARGTWRGAGADEDTPQDPKNGGEPAM